MKKAISILLCITICFLFCACNSDTQPASNVTTSNTTSTQTPKGNKANINTDLLQGNKGIGRTPAYQLRFDTYDRFLAHLSDKATPQNSLIHSLKSDFGEKYERLIDHLVAKDHIEMPHYDGERIFFSLGVSIYGRASYSMPCVFYSGYTDYGRMMVAISYPQLEYPEDFQETLSGSEALKMLDPEKTNIHNFQDKDSNRFNSAYERKIKLKDRIVSALVLDEMDSDTFYTKVVYIYYGSMFIEFSMTDETYNSDFFEHFSMQ